VSTRTTDRAIRPTAAALSNIDGSQSVQWNIPLDAADRVLALLAQHEQENANLGKSLPGALPDSIAALRSAVSEGYDRMIEQTLGCLDMSAGDSLLLLDAVTIESGREGTSVLLPGDHTPCDAVTAALDVLRDRSGDIDPTTLVADVARPRWMVLRPCENPAHAAHPDIAPDGFATVGAVLATRVDFTHN
jgi:hypothetical protein